MKKNFINLLFISFFLFLFFPFNVKADDGYVIEKYNVDIKVNENNVLNITETIDVNFKIDSRGIQREIPIKNKYLRKDIEVKTKAKIKNLKVNREYYKSEENGKLILKIYNPNKYFTGKRQYIISYDYDIGDDNIDLYDDLYFNIIGNEWSTQIKEATFKIQMPKEFDETLVNFTVGYSGSTYYEDVKYSIQGNTIEGYILPDRVYGYALNAGEGLTVRIELPEGYFTGERAVFDPTSLIIYGLIILSIAIIVLEVTLFRRYSYHKKDLLVVEYVVPDNLSPAEIGYLYNGYVKSNHIVSLITYFANKGYLQIIDEGKNKFSLKKIKDIPNSEPDYAKTTFNGLFKKANDKGIVKKSDIEEKFYTTLNTATMKLKKTHEVYNTSHYVCNVIYIFGIIIMFFLPFLLIFTTYRLEKYYSIHMIIYIFLTFISIVLSILFIIFNKKRTEEGIKYYNKIRGFKHYLEFVEKDKLEALVEENPNYFYDILPYAYVLGVSDKWSKKFESIIMEPPTWYEGNMYSVTTGMFNVNTFNNSLNHTLSGVSSTMSSRPYQSSGTSGGGSFSGGGGFSGGGAGGGGGSRL